MKEFAASENNTSNLRCEPSRRSVQWRRQADRLYGHRRL